VRESTVIAEWQAEGRWEVHRDSIRRVLQARFLVPVPDDLATAIQAEADSEVLGRWLDIAATAVSLDAFRSTIQR
jgi:hypothetical protein